jgi:hypothetical protein
MWAGVRPGLQILWICLWWIGRFDSDTLPPSSQTCILIHVRVLKRRPSRLEFIPLSPRKPPKKKPFKGWKEVKRRARERVGLPPPTRREESPRNKPPKHKKRELEEEQARD